MPAQSQGHLLGTKDGLLCAAALPNGSIAGGATAGPQDSLPHHQQQQAAEPPAAGGAGAGLPPPTEGYVAEAPPEPQLQPDLPSLVPVVCNNNRAALDVRRMAIVLPSGRDVTPTEFERMCGKGASKKWKASLRIDKGGCACRGDALLRGLKLQPSRRGRPACTLTTRGCACCSDDIVWPSAAVCPGSRLALCTTGWGIAALRCSVVELVQGLAWCRFQAACGPWLSQQRMTGPPTCLQHSRSAGAPATLWPPLQLTSATPGLACAHGEHA